MKQTTLSEHEKAINKVVEYINHHLYEKPSIIELASIANISGFHFHRIFKLIIGENIGEFINRLRMEDIALRLLMQNNSLSDVALEIGYETKYALSKAFKNHFGMPPSRYRSQAQDLHPHFGDNNYQIYNLVPEIKTIKAKMIAYIRIIDVYGAEESFTKAWAELGRYAQSYDLLDENTEFLGLSFDDPNITPPSKCRFYACFTPSQEAKPEGAIGVRSISGGKYAVFCHKGDYKYLKDMYYNIFKLWLPTSGYRLRSSMSFERYLNSPTTTAKKNLTTQIYVPISS